MSFSLEKLFVDVLAPRADDAVTIMYDLPHGEIRDTPEWRDRRALAEEWQQEIGRFASKHGFRVHPVVTYEATGLHNGGLPEHGLQAGRAVRLEDIGRESTIIISMPEFSATAPLAAFARENENLRVASLPAAGTARPRSGTWPGTWRSSSRTRTTRT